MLNIDEQTKNDEGFYNQQDDKLL